MLYMIPLQMLAKASFSVVGLMTVLTFSHVMSFLKAHIQVRIDMEAFTAYLGTHTLCIHRNPSKRHGPLFTHEASYCNKGIHLIRHDKPNLHGKRIVG